MPFRRSTGAPTSSATPAAASPPAAKLTAKGVPPSHNWRMTNEPMPKKAACPRLICPANPARMFQLEASDATMKTVISSSRFLVFSVPSAETSGQAMSNATTTSGTIQPQRRQSLMRRGEGGILLSSADGWLATALSEQALRAHTQNNEKDH